MKLPILIAPVKRGQVNTAFHQLRVESVQPAAIGTCYDNTACQTRGVFNQKGILCNNCTIAQCNNLGGQAWHGSLRMYGDTLTDCWPMNAGLVEREQRGMA